MIQLIPLSQTEINWPKYLATVAEALGLSLETRTSKSIADYLATLAKIEGQANGSLLEHIHVGFMLIATKQAAFAIIARSRLSTTTVPSEHDDFSFVILTGTLGEWRTAITNCCVDSVSLDVRSFGTQMLAYFDQIGITLVDEGFRVNKADGTIRVINNQ